MLDFQALNEKQITIEEMTAGLGRDDLHRLTDEMVDDILQILGRAVDSDVVFLPVDSQANDTFATDPADVKIAWSLGHVIVHITASAEEAASRAASMARGIPIKDRSRFEVPWQEVHTLEHLRKRLEESRRMRHGFLDAWPDIPHLELHYAPWPGANEINAVGQFVFGLRHDFSHLDQLREIMRQASASRERQD